MFGHAHNGGDCPGHKADLGTSLRHYLTFQFANVEDKSCSFPSAPIEENHNRKEELYHLHIPFVQEGLHLKTGFTYFKIQDINECIWK